MILPDHEIKKYLKEGKIIVEPLEDTNVQIQAAWVDLKLGNEFKVFKHTSEPFIDSKDPKEYTETLKSADGKPIMLHPREFMLGATKERIKLPLDIAAYLDGRSSLGRLGITAHITAGWIDPGWDGKLVVEITNLGKMPVTIYPDMRIAKIIFFKLTSPAEILYGAGRGSKYYGQSAVAESKIHKEYVC